MNGPYSLVEIAAVELRPTGRELLGEIDFDWGGTRQRGRADLVREGRGHLSISWRDEDGVRVLDAPYAEPHGALVYRELERKLLDQLKGRLGDLQGSVDLGPRVTDVRLKAATYTAREQGLLGWVSFRIADAILIEGVAVRRTINNSLVLSFPEPTDSRGKRHRPVRPLDDESRLRIERQVFSALDVTPRSAL